jgi:hypothetical protein
LTWDDHRHLDIYIEASMQFHQPPLRFMLEDPSRAEWSKWDIRIANAYHIKKQFEENGVPLWLAEHPGVTWMVRERTSRPQAKLEEWNAKEQKRKKPRYGVSPYLEPVLPKGMKRPTKREWLESKRGGGNWGAQIELVSGKVVELNTASDQMRIHKERLEKKRRNRPKGTGKVE